MNLKDFEYDGEYLSDWGYIICDIDVPDGFETINSDSQLTFESVSQYNGKYFPLTISYYTNCIEIPIQIAKFRCPDGLQPIKVDEIRELKRWLNRPDHHKFKLIQPDWSDIYMMGSFNISEIKFNDITYALELTFTSNRPFALHEPLSYYFSLNNDSTYVMYDESDEIGHIYPNITLTCLSAGNIEFINSQEPERKTIIHNVSQNEVITFTPALIISSSLSSHIIQNDFNFIFPRISNRYGNRKNVFSSSLPVRVEMTYSPIVKVVR